MCSSIVLFSVPIVYEKSAPKVRWWGTVLFGLHFNIVLHNGRKLSYVHKQGRDMEVRADAEAVEARYLLACSLLFTQPTFLLNLWPPT